MMRLGIAGGATKIVVGAFASPQADGSCRWLANQVLETSRVFEQDMAAVRGAVGLLAATFGKTYGPIEAIGMAAAGQFDSARRKLVLAGDLPGWVDQPLADTMEAMVPGAACVFGNNGLAQALHEARNNPELQGVDFVLFNPGSGIATARITWVNGQPFALSIEAQRFGLPPELLTAEHWALVAEAQGRCLAMILTHHPVGVVVYGGGSVSEKQPQLMELVQQQLNRFAGGGVSAHLVRATCTKLEGARTGLALLPA